MTAVIATPAVAAEIAGQVGVPTLTTFAADVKLSPEIADALWKHLEVDPETDVEVAASIPQGILDDSLESFRAEHPFHGRGGWTHLPPLLEVEGIVGSASRAGLDGACGGACGLGACFG